MANEITTTTQLIFDDGEGGAFTLGGNSDITSMGNAILIRQKVSVGATEAALPKGSVSTIGWAWFKNYSDTATVTIRTTTGGTDFLKILPNAEQLIYIGTTMAPWVITSSGSVTLEYALFAA